MQRIDIADRFFAATGADVRHGGARAFYAEGPDYVQMPPFETFRDAENHAATTLAHELTHNAERWIMPCGTREGIAAPALAASVSA